MSLLTELDARIDRMESDLAHLRATRLIVAPGYSGAAKPTKAAKAAKAPKRAADSSGALTGRVLAIVREAGKDGITPADVVHQAKAPDYHVRLMLKELAADGKLQSTGATTTKRYTIAKGGKK